MAGLIGTGRETLAQANRGLADLSAIETQRRAARDQMEASVRSQQASVGGIGTAVFGPKIASGAGAALNAGARSLAAKGAFGSKIAGDLAALQGLSATAAPTGAFGAGAVGGAGAAGAGGAAAAEAAALAQAAGAGAAGAAGATAAGGAAAGTAAAAGTTAAATAAGTTAAAGMAAAAPWVLLALGGAYLVGKMFD